MNDEISTCAVSLIVPGHCCYVGCHNVAIVAVLHRRSEDLRLTECARCAEHLTGNWLASKPMPEISEAWR